MKNLKFREIKLISEVERRAKTLDLDHQTTIILGQNDTGKSCVAKSLYRALGCQSSKVHPRWASAEVSVMLRFSIDGHDYTSLQYGKSYYIHDEVKNVFSTFYSTDDGLGPYISKLLDFDLALPRRGKTPKPPPPAFIFLPFYLDQDSSWVSTWSAFTGLGNYAGWRKSLVEYHIGVRPKEYYQVVAALSVKKQERTEVRRNQGALEQAKTQLLEQFPAPILPVNIDEYETEVLRLTKLIQELQSEEGLRLEKLIKLNNRKAIIQSQLSVAKNAQKELQDDFHFASTQVKAEIVDCPTCGATYDNQFGQRFGLANDVERIAEILESLNADLVEVKAEIAKAQPIHEQVRAVYKETTELLAKTKDGLTLSHILRSQGRVQATEAFDGALHQVVEESMVLDQELERLANIRKSISDPVRVNAILDFYKETMSHFLFKTGVSSFNQDSYMKIDSKINETGSDHPRALLAYYFSILHTISQHGNSIMAPLVIDSPNQQGQDSNNLKKMLRFISDYRPMGCQLILVTEELYGVEIDGNCITLDQPDQLLQEDEYMTCKEELLDFLRQAMENN